MLSVAEAQKCVLEQVRPLPSEAAWLDASALGLVLAEDVLSDLDMPPFAKAMMDGYAVRAEDLVAGAGQLTVIEEITAGNIPSRVVGQGQAARIMTGAPLPEGVDCVVMIERSQYLDGDIVHIDDASLRPGQ